MRTGRLCGLDERLETLVGCLGNDPRTYGVKARCVANYTNNPLKLGEPTGSRTRDLTMARSNVSNYTISS